MLFILILKNHTEDHVMIWHSLICIQATISFNFKKSDNCIVRYALKKIRQMNFSTNVSWIINYSHFADLIKKSDSN